MAVWRIRSLYLSRREVRYVVGSMIYEVVWEQVYGMLRQLALPEFRAFMRIRETTRPSMARLATAPTASPTCRSVHHPHPRTSCSLGDRTSRHEASYVHCTLGGTTSRNQLPSWWLLRGSEKWETLYALSQEVDFADELRKAATVSFKDTKGNGRQSLFFLCAGGKAQLLMAGCQNWKAESPRATVCWVACAAPLFALLPLA